MDGFVCEGRFVRVEIPAGRPSSRMCVFDRENGVGYQCREPGGFITINQKNVFQYTLGVEEAARADPVVHRRTKNLEDFGQEYRSMAERIQELPDLFSDSVWQGL